MNLKLIIAAIILLPIVLHLGYAAANSTFANYYVTVDEYVARPTSAPTRVGGAVIPGSIQWDSATRTMQFKIRGDQSSLDVVYRGMAPDAFRDSTTVILEGARSAGGAFLAKQLTVKCPHQYLPAG